MPPSASLPSGSRGCCHRVGDGFDLAPLPSSCLSRWHRPRRRSLSTTTAAAEGDVSINTGSTAEFPRPQPRGQPTSPPLGHPLPLDEHACSVSLPTWSSVVGYEEGDVAVSQALACGYPRFVYHPYVLKLMDLALEMEAAGNGNGNGERYEQQLDCVVLPTEGAAVRCRDFLVRALGYAYDDGGGAGPATGRRRAPRRRSRHGMGGAGNMRLLRSDNALDDTDDYRNDDASSELSFGDDDTSAAHDPIRVVDLGAAGVYAVIFPATTEAAIEAKSYWQHTGEIVSSRRAEAALTELGRLDLLDGSANDEEKVGGAGGEGSCRVTPRFKGGDGDGDQSEWRVCGPPPFSADGGTTSTASASNEWRDSPAMTDGAPPHLALFPSSSSSSDDDADENPADGVRRRIASLTAAASPDSVTLTPSGMAAIYTALRSARRRRLLLDLGDVSGGGNGGGTAVVYGFPYLDTLKMCGRPELVPGGVDFFGRGDAKDLDALERRLARRAAVVASSSKGGAPNTGGGGDSGDSQDAGVCALVTEFPSNPLLRCPDLYKLRELADTYNFALIVDDTIGNFTNLNLLESGLADAVCTSLTKLFNGRGDAMAGSVVCNERTPIGRWMAHDLSRRNTASVKQDDDGGGLWHGDAAAILANSVDFEERSHKINETAEGLATWLHGRPEVDTVYYPKFTNPELYHAVMAAATPAHPSLEEGGQQQQQHYAPGYGGLMSLLLHPTVCHQTFYDTLDVCKGPSLGTNFTLVCPYTLLAHYHELDFALRYGVKPNLMRIAIGLEDECELRGKFEEALEKSRRTGLDRRRQPGTALASSSSLSQSSFSGAPLTSRGYSTMAAAAAAAAQSVTPLTTRPMTTLAGWPPSATAAAAAAVSRVHRKSPSSSVSQRRLLFVSAAAARRSLRLLLR